MLPLTDPQAVQLLVGCFNHEFLLSHLALTHTQPLPYIQPCQMFRLEVLHRGGLSGMHGCYLYKLYFCLEQHFPPFFLLTGVVYFSPKVGGAERRGFANIPTIHQWLTELMKLKLTAA